MSQTKQRDRAKHIPDFIAMRQKTPLFAAGITAATYQNLIGVIAPADSRGEPVRDVING